MSTTGWIVTAVVVLALVALVAYAVSRRGQAGGELGVGGVEFKVRGGRGPEAAIKDSTTKMGGATARSIGDARIERVEAKQDLTAEAGLSQPDPKGSKPEK